MIGFGGSSISNNGKASIEKNNPRKPTAISHNDPFLVFESTTSSKSFLDSLEQITKNGSKHTSGSSTPPHYRGLLPSQRMFQTQSTAQVYHHQ
ncbi:hypothetical protein MtrunA17_Chr2g0321891 [Medicago truncatula]|uniref:Uncharacterized protein n=1 Tax=Medicago truncatula TaxID=3880 RepID=A0A396JGM0_MEDTR|nr:hypothetical protein MtrunA17_Chr2g0321891 [Medicago truncatula]